MPWPLLVCIHYHESGILGASPDGFVSEDFISSGIVHLQEPNQPQLTPDIIEITCPFTARNVKVQEACLSIKDFFLGIHFFYMEYNSNCSDYCSERSMLRTQLGFVSFMQTKDLCNCTHFIDYQVSLQYCNNTIIIIVSTAWVRVYLTYF